MWLLLVYIIVWAISPGPVAVITLLNTGKFGSVSGVVTALGATASAAIMVVLALGIHFLGFQPNAESFGMEIVEVIGALGIVAMGIYAAYSSLFNHSDSSQTLDTQPITLKVGFSQGFAVMSTYIPHAIIFYTLIVPQTVQTDALLPTILGLGITKVALVFIWHTGIAILANRANRIIQRDSIQRWTGFATACLLVGIGSNMLIG